MISCIYDQAVYLTNEEYQQKTGCAEDIQAKIESPEVYIIARSSSSDVEQLAYIDTRLECVQDMVVPLITHSGNPLTDVMRFFHGDSPARQFECGQQKGGNYYCSGCGAKAQRAYELDYCLRSPYISLSDRQHLVLKGPVGRKKIIGTGKSSISWPI